MINPPTVVINATSNACHIATFATFTLEAPRVETSNQILKDLEELGRLLSSLGLIGITL